MIARLASITFVLMVLASLGASALSLLKIYQDPLWAPLVAATEDEIRATVDRELAREATPDRLSEKIAARLAEEPRNWLALDALRDLADERKIALPGELVARFDSLREEDHSYLAMAESCATCAWDGASCSLTQVMICRAPIEISPIGDLEGVVRAVSAMLAGEDIDKLDLALSVVGLAATAASVESAGSSLTVKLGAGLLKLARGMHRLPRALELIAIDAVTSGIDLAQLNRVTSLEDLKRLIRFEKFEPLTSVARDLNAVRESTDVTTALHLLPLVEDAGDARKLAAASKALGRSIVADAEVLGKSRLFRATLRLSSIALRMVSALVGLLVSCALLVGHALQSVFLRAMRRKLKAVARNKTS